MMIKNQWKLTLLLLPLAGVLSAYFYKKTKPLIIVDPVSGLDTRQYNTILFTDSLSGGNSSIELLDDPFNRLAYRYTLNNKVNAPTVRLMIESTNKPYLDLSSYNKMSITMKSAKGKQIPLVICNAIPYHSRPDEINTYQLAIQYSSVSPNFQTRELALKDFTTPDWWYSFASNKQYQNVKPKVALAKYVFLTNSSFSANFNSDTVIVSELRFEYDFTVFFIQAAIGTAIYYALCLLLFYFPQIESVEKVYLWYKKIDTVNYEEADKNRIKIYLQDNFQNPELTISDVQTATGIHQRKISGIIKKDSQLTFKAYLNQLRIEKAKSLLSDTGLSVSAIAFESGYNSITHFNRVFKNELQLSPQEFRANQKSPHLVI